MKKTHIYPSVLASNFLKLGEDIQLINQSEATSIHLDVMDGVFVPNISFGASICKQISTLAQKPLDIHLMIVNPERYIDTYIDAGANALSIHLEATVHAHRLVSVITSKGILAGLAINPQTPASLLSTLLPLLDQVVVMGVNPGFGGQKLIQHTYQKVEKLRAMIDGEKLNTKIIIDGGVSLKNAKDLLLAGADVLVAGSCVFQSKEPLITIKSLKNAAD